MKIIILLLFSLLNISVMNKVQVLEEDSPTGRELND